MEQSRRKNYYRNISTGMVLKCVNMVTSFVNRTVFIYTLGAAYLGVSGLFTDILSIFSLAELGIGNAITFHLYKPLATDDKEEIKSLMFFYKTCYRVIGCVILVAGLCILPFLDKIITDVDHAIQVNIRVVYVLYLINTVTSYLFFTYKTTLLSAAQKAYKSQIIEIVYSLVSVILFSGILLTTHNFLMYLVVKIGSDIVKNVVISKEIDKIFPLLKEKDHKRFTKEKIKEITGNIYAVFVGKISGTIFTSTDSIIISKYISTVVVGVMNNYRMITTNITALAGMITGALLPAVGDMAARQSKEECRIRFKNYNFLCFWVYSFLAVCMLYTFNPFITAWVGKNMLFGRATVIVFVLNFWLDLILQMVYSFRAAYGLYKYGEYLQLIGAICNIFLSIKLIPVMGVTGVLLATSITNLPTFLYPYYLYKYGFEHSAFEYYKNLFIQIIALLLACAVSGFLCQFAQIGGFGEFVLKGMICAIVTNVLFLLLFFRTPEFQFAKGEAINVWNKFLRK